MDTPWYIPQRHDAPIDLSLPSDEIMTDAKRHCKETVGFMPLDTWKTHARPSGCVIGADRPLGERAGNGRCH